MKNSLLVLGLVTTTFVHAATHESIVVKTGVGIDRTKKPPRVVIELTFHDEKTGNIITDRILKVDSHVKSSDSYVLKAGKKPVSLEEVRLRNYDSSDETAGAIQLVPKENLKADADYCIEVKPNVWHFVNGVTPPVVKDCVKVTKEEIKTELEYADHRELKNKVEFKSSGSSVAAGSVRYTYNYDSPLSQYPSWWHFEALGKADFNLLSEDRAKYFNSIVGQVSGFYVNSWTTPWGDKAQIDQRQSPYYVGLSGNVESDQKFETVDSTVGIQVRSFVKNPVTDFLYGLMVFGEAKNEAGIKPRFELGYAYVGHIKESMDTHSGSNRFTGTFSWWVPVLRNQGFSPLVRDRVADVDFQIEVGGIYDIEKSELTDTTNLSLDIHWRKALEKASDKDPSFTLSYAQGKATPTFKHFDAFLAGLKIPF
jgi:hypothetical protein